MALMDRDGEDYQPDKFVPLQSDAEADAEYERWTAKFEREQANAASDEEKEYQDFVRKLEKEQRESYGEYDAYDPDAFSKSQDDIRRQSEADERKWGEDWTG